MKTTIISMLWIASLCLAFFGGRYLPFKQTSTDVGYAPTISGKNSVRTADPRKAMQWQDQRTISAQPTPGEMEIKLKQLLVGPMSPQADAEIAEMCRKLGALRGEDAFILLEGINGRLRELATSSILAGWAGVSPAKAWNWALTEAKRGDMDIGSASLNGGIRDLMMLASVIYKNGDGQVIPELVAGMGDSATKNTLAGFYARMMAQYDAEGALVYIGQLEGRARSSAIQGVAREIAKEAPEAAAAWALNLPADEGKGVFRSVLAEWCSKDGESAVTWIKQQPSSPALDGAIDFLVSEGSRKLLEAHPEVMTKYHNTDSAKNALERLRSRDRYGGPNG